MGPAECALAMGRAFGARLLWPRGDDPGYARFRLEELEVVIVTDSGTLRESLDA